MTLEDVIRFHFSKAIPQGMDCSEVARDIQAHLKSLGFDSRLISYIATSDGERIVPFALHHKSKGYSEYLYHTVLMIKYGDTPAGYFIVDATQNIFVPFERYDASMRVAHPDVAMLLFEGDLGRAVPYSISTVSGLKRKYRQLK